MMDAASNQPSEKMRQRFSCAAIPLLVIAGIGPVTGMSRDLDLSEPEDAMETEEYAQYQRTAATRRYAPDDG